MEIAAAAGGLIGFGAATPTGLASVALMVVTGAKVVDDATAVAGLGRLGRTAADGTEVSTGLTGFPLLAFAAFVLATLAALVLGLLVTFFAPGSFLMVTGSAPAGALLVASALTATFLGFL